MMKKTRTVVACQFGQKSLAELELEYLDSDPDSDADLEMDHDMDSDSDVDMPPQEPLPPTPEPMPVPLPIRLTIRRINGNFVTDGQVPVRRSARERVPNKRYA